MIEASTKPRRTACAVGGLWLLVTALAVATPAAAQPTEKSDPAPVAEPGDATKDGKAIAREHFKRGKDLHAVGKYHAAAEAYLVAYEHLPAPAFLYNAGQVLRLAGDAEAALQYYRKYLDLDPRGEAASDARDFINQLEAEMAAARPVEPEPDQARRSRPAGGPATGARPPPSPSRDDRGSRPGRKKKIIGASLGAAGLVALGVAAGFGLKARAVSNEVSDHEGPWTSELTERYREGESAERTMAITTILGGAAVAAGAVLYIAGGREAGAAGRSEGRPAAVELVPAGAGDGAVLLLGGRF